MINRFLPAGILALATAVSPFASAEDSANFGADKRFYGAAQVSYNYFDSDGGLDDQAGYQVALGKPIFSWLDLELQAFSVGANDANNGPDRDYQGIGLAARILPGRYTMPFYGLLAYSVGDDQTAGNSQDTEFLEAGIGYVHALSSHGSSLRAEYRARRTRTDGLSIEPVNHLVAIGVEIPFGAAKPLNENNGLASNYRNIEVSQRLATADWTSRSPCLDADFDGVCDDADQCANTPVGVVVDATGCAPKVEPETPLVVGTPMVLEGVEFEFDSDQLTTASLPILDRAAETLITHRGIPVEVAGHTDSKGSPSYNLNLSTVRAKVVYEYLIAKGVSAGRLSYNGYGEAEPIAENQLANGQDNPEGRARNRRVELRALEQ